ncbi:hypothetical protein niasHT_002027 [Heterodera trifolii]|uniref:tRNA-dihydrouridine(47) synthase [NAD(P)(+)] n=1 Tax=Heterodera trifolii TaxID=157864 RepID=A0ABD2M2W0_9BILA
MADWNDFFGSLRKYLNYFRAHHSQGLSYNALTTSSNTQTISDAELAGLLSWTRFASAVAKKDAESRRQMYEERSWNCVETTTGLLTCSIPLVLKQALFELLAALATDEICAVNIWNCLLCEGICVQKCSMLGEKLGGIQRDLEEQEANLKVYNCTQGFLTLLRILLSHKTRPNSHQLAPFIQFTVHSVLCQFSTRSYVDSNQMWKIVKLALDSLYEPLKTFYATPVVVQNKATEVQILTQLLSDSPLSRSILQIIVEGADRLRENAPVNLSRDDATFSAIRLFYMAISHRTAMADAIRMANSDLMVVSVESLLFSVIPHSRRSNINYLSLLFHYLSEFDHLSRHSFYVWLIIKEAAAQRPSVQLRIVQALLPRRAQLITSAANLSAVFAPDDISISIVDLLPKSIEQSSSDRLRGQLCRLMFEVFNDSMESNPNTPNIAYALMNFDLSNIPSTVLDIPRESSEGLTVLHNLIFIAEQFAVSEDPFVHPFSGLYDSVLRLLYRLCSIRAASSAILLRFLRSQYDLIYRLANSSIFCSIGLPTSVNPSTNDTFSSSFLQNFGDESIALEVVHKTAQGVILELIALEVSTLLRIGFIAPPQRFLKILLSPGNPQNTPVSLLPQPVDEPSTTLFWLLLDSSRIFVEDLEMPNCVKFDTQRVLELLNFCVRKNSNGIEQFDVFYLHLLLNSEINCIMNTEIGLIKKEAAAILDYCMLRNARNLLEGACVRLLEGWLSVMNVLSVHCPLPFIDAQTHQCLLVDALFLLRSYCNCVEMSPELASSVALCISRTVRAICGIFHRIREVQPNLSPIRRSLLPILHLLLQIIVLPGYSKSIAFKMELYSSCLRVLDVCNAPPKSETEKVTTPVSKNTTMEFKNLCDFLLSKTKSELFGGRMEQNDERHDGGSDPLAEMFTEKGQLEEIWAQLFTQISHEIVRTISFDILFAPLPLKLVAAATFIDVLREDIRNGGGMAQEFVFSGSLQCVQDTTMRIEQSELKIEKRGEVRRSESTKQKQTESLTKALKFLVVMAQSSVKNLALILTFAMGDAHFAGCAHIKSEYVVLRSETQQQEGGNKPPNESNPLEQNSHEGILPRNTKARGMDRQREQKMAKARAENRQKIVRICPSVLFESEGRKCKYGEKCDAEHSLTEYWAKKPPDIGPSCFLFDQMGKCSFSLSCCFARAHTNESDLSQKSKTGHSEWQSVLNTHTLPIQQQLRKRTYNFSRSEHVLHELESPTGCMEREAPKWDMRTLHGKKYLAPLTTVGNLPFRRLCVELGAEVTCGEMAIATHLLQGLPSELSLMKRHPSEKIFGVQLAGGYPDSLGKAVQLITDNFNVDFIDLNLGCPLDSVNEKGAGCSLANKSNKLVSVLQSMQKSAAGVPVSVKMRYGVKEGERTAHYTMGTLAERSPPQLLTLHPRSREQRYTKAAEWDYVLECEQRISGRFPFFVCGDVMDYEEYYQRIEKYPIDGIMIGRGALIKPWIFTEIEEHRRWDITSSERLELIKKFVNYGLENWGSDSLGVENTRRYLLEWLSFQHRYIPVGLLEVLPQQINHRPPLYRGRDELETLLSSPASSDWVRISEMLLGKVPDGFLFVPKHKASAYWI